ncbi:MAG: hypothetical protein HY543_12475 [Deltaproteobacteria bacterium]|nr:hypothetical protein [Deltaproteobacteria bacterium]
MSKRVSAFVRQCVSHGSLLLLFVCGGCAKPMIRANARMLTPITRTFSADPNRVYYAIRWALAAQRYPVARENLPEGIVTTAWLPTTSDSHFIRPFQSRDFGVVPGYHQIEIRVEPEGGASRVSVTSRLKGIVAYMESSHRAERAVLDEIAHYLHSGDLGVTNLGAEE